MMKEMEMRTENPKEICRRQFIKRASIALSAIPVLQIGTLALSGCTKSSNPVLQAQSSTVKPENLSPRIKMVSDDEPGVPMIVSGIIYAADGVTPAEGVTLYVYHTDARGLYSDEDGNGGPPKPRLKGWMKTGADGRYEFRSIKPASYPGSRNPAHIHSSVAAAGHTERWIKEFWFEGDPFIPREMSTRASGQGAFSEIMALKSGENGILKYTRDIKLERQT
jgi:protocatechuate 3,4-dioxygenase beta subunit